jgi:hypothetical protein
MLKFNLLEKTEFAVTPEFSIQREGFAAWKPDGYLSLSVPTITTSQGAVPSAGIAQAAVLGADETGLFFVELPTK